MPRPRADNRPLAVARHVGCCSAVWLDVADDLNTGRGIVGMVRARAADHDHFVGIRVVDVGAAGHAALLISVSFSRKGASIRRTQRSIFVANSSLFLRYCLIFLNRYTRL